MRPLIISALMLSFTLTASAGEGEKVDVKTLPDAVKAAVTKEAPDATQVMKTPGKDGKTVYHVKSKDADGKPVIVMIGEDGTVLGKHGPKDKDHEKKEK
jgi:hypothetical protein